MLTPKQIQDEAYWKDAWESAQRYQTYLKEKKMLAFTIGEDGREDMQGQWLVKETIAGDSDRLFVLAVKDDVEKKLWVNRSWLEEVDAPEAEPVVEETPTEEEPE
jgi:hypothetical protein